MTQEVKIIDSDLKGFYLCMREHARRNKIKVSAKITNFVALKQLKRNQETAKLTK